jgi:hypothetical protein
MYWFSQGKSSFLVQTSGSGKCVTWDNDFFKNISLFLHLLPACLYYSNMPQRQNAVL